MLRARGALWPETRRTRGGELRPTTRAHYRLLLDTYSYPTFGNERLDAITRGWPARRLFDDGPPLEL
ncbi:hypothetical protein [Aeromicrobium sp.]